MEKYKKDSLKIKKRKGKHEKQGRNGRIRRIGKRKECKMAKNKKKEAWGIKTKKGDKCYKNIHPPRRAYEIF